MYFIICGIKSHSHQNLSYLRSGVDYPRFLDDDTAEELLTPLLRQLNFWCECGVSQAFSILMCKLAITRLGKLRKFPVH